MTQTPVEKKILNTETGQTTRNPSVLFRRVSALILILVSALILCGWSFGNPLLISVKSAWPVVAPLTALDFLCIGFAMYLLPEPDSRASALRQGFILALAIPVTLTSGAVIVRYFLSLQLPLDLLFFKEPSGDPHAEFRTTMAPSTALCFFLSSFWFVGDFVKPRFDVLKSSISVFVLGVSLLMLGAYVYGASNLYHLPDLIRMSAVTAGMFAVMHLGLLIGDGLFGIKLQSPLKFFRDKNTVSERPLYISLLVVFTVFLVAGAMTSQSLNRLIETGRTVAEIQKHIQELDRLYLGLLNAESGQRGFLLTGNDEYLDSYFIGTKEYATSMAALQEWIHQNPKYQETFFEIEKTADVKLKELGETIASRRAKGLSAATKVVQTDVGYEAMAHIRDLVNFIKQDQLNYLTEQREENQIQVRSTIASITVGSLIATVLLLTCLNLYIKNSLKRSEVENQIRMLNKKLENKIHEVEIVNKELESFSYSVSHDLRAPLRAMAGFSNILIEDYQDKLDEAGRGYLRRIIAAADKMARLIDGILDLSRIARKKLSRTDIDISSMAEQILTELAMTEPTRNVKVEIEPALHARGDVDLVGAVLQNLLSNAWKFTAKKDLAHIAVGAMMKDGVQVFFVRDDGAGFDMAYAEKLFGTFQRLHSENEFKGTGVGLASVRRIVHLHGGEVWAEGIVGQGATFYFTLG